MVVMKKKYKKELTTKERLFAKYYVMYGVKKIAALKAGYSKNTATYVGTALTRKPHVAAAIKEEEAKVFKKADVTINKILKQYERLAFSDINDYYKNVYVLNSISGYDGLEVQRKKTIIGKYIGVTISELEYEALSKHYQYYYTCENILKPFEELTKDQRASIAGLSYDRSGNPVLKLSAKERSLDALANYLGMFKPKDSEEDKPPSNLDIKVSFE